MLTPLACAAAHMPGQALHCDAIPCKLAHVGQAMTLHERLGVQGATSVLFFEARKRTDLYLWLSKVPSGPSVRFLCTNVHTMAELKLSGNHLKGSRPVLAFDAAFDEQPQLQVRVARASAALDALPMGSLCREQVLTRTSKL